MTSFERYTVAADHLTLDLIAWRRFKKPDPGLVERMIALNPTVAAQGILLPFGSVVIIPVDAPADQPKEVTAVRLWD